MEILIAVIILGIIAVSMFHKPTEDLLLGGPEHPNADRYRDGYS